MSKREKISLGLAITGIVWWFVENFYFGWHMTATAPLEGVADFMVWVFIIIAFFIRPTNTRIENTTINTQTVEFIKPNMKANFNDLSKEKDKEQAE